MFSFLYIIYLSFLNFYRNCKTKGISQLKVFPENVSNKNQTESSTTANILSDNNFKMEDNQETHIIDINNENEIDNLPHRDLEPIIIHKNDRTKIYLKNNKIYKYYKPFNSFEEQKSLIELLKKNQHENICIPCNYYILDSLFIEESIQYSFDLFHALENNLINFENIYSYIKQLSSAIYHLHYECQYAHRDLKPENILIKELNGEYIFLLTDFDFSCEINNDSKFQGGSESYAGPEIFMKEKNDWGKLDIWALGIVIYILIFKEFPWKIALVSDEYYSDFDLSKNKYLYFLQKFGDLQNISKEYKFYATILYYCLKQEPNKRINSQQLINLLNKYK